MKTTFVYPSYNAFISDALGPSEMIKQERASRRGDGTPDPLSDMLGEDWSGDSWRAAEHKALHGDVDGAKKLSAIMVKAANVFMNQAPRLDPVYKLDEGRWIDVARFVKGEPECWGDMVESDPMPKSGLGIILNVSAAGRVDASKLDKLGATIAGVMIGLQSMGNSVTVFVADKTIRNDASKPLLVSAPVNTMGASLDMAYLSAVIRPWFLRRIMFSWMETRDEGTRREYSVPGSYGMSADLTADEARVLTGIPNTVVLNLGTLRIDAVQSTLLTAIKGGK